MSAVEKPTQVQITARVGNSQSFLRRVISYCRETDGALPVMVRRGKQALLIEWELVKEHFSEQAKTN